MRSREREQDPPPSESSPTPLAPPPRPAQNLSSMVVRPSDTASGGGGVDFDSSDLNHRLHSPTPASYRRESSPHPLHRQRGGDSPPPFRRRRESPAGFVRRDSPPAFRQRSPPVFHHPRSQRFHDNQGYMPRAGSISPTPRRPRMDDSHYDPDFDHAVGGPRFGRGFRGGRGGGRFRDTSPHNGFGRGSRSFGRGYDVDRRGLSPFEGEYVHRNDPNLSPREGDWICGNPRCGNLNFARRTHCNNCDQPRSAPGRPGPIRSPRRGGYFTSPSCGSPPGTTVAPPIERGVRRNFNGYRSPPRGWAAEGPRDFSTGSPPRRHRGGGRGRFQDHMRRDRDRDSRVGYEDDDYRGGRGKFEYLPVDEEWETTRDDGFIPPERRGGYDRRPPSPLPRERWVCERSRSPPIGGRPLKSSYMGRDRDYRRLYDDDDSYINRGRTNDSSGLGGRGRGFQRRGDDSSFVSRGRGDRRGMAPARNSNGDLY